MSHYSVETKILPDPLRSLNTATLAGAYLPIGDPLDRPIRLIKFANVSNVTVTVSWDGITDHDILPLGGYVLPITSLQSNVEGSQGIYIAKGTQFYIKGAAGVGFVYLTCIG
jgi:hypothetical protein